MARKRQELPVILAELINHAKTDVGVVQERDVQPTLDGAFVDGDLLQPFEKWFGKDVVEDVDFQCHRCEVWSSPCAGQRDAPRRGRRPSFDEDTRERLASRETGRGAG